MVVIVFDLDGVLVDSAQAFTSSVNEALDSLGFSTYSHNAILDTFDVKNKTKSLAQWGIPIENSEVVNEFEKRYIAFRSKKTPALVPQAKQILDLLQRKGAKLYLLSATNPDEYKSFFTKHNIAQYFTEMYLQTSQKTDCLREIYGDHKQPVYFVGDSVSDLTCAQGARKKGANITFIGVLHKVYGVSSSRQIHWSNEDEMLWNLRTSDSEKTIRNLSELFDIISEVNIR